MRSIARILCLALFAMVACGEPPPEYCGAPEDTNLREETYTPGGLYLSDNPNTAPSGSLQRADNVALREDGYLEPLRGFAQDVDPQVAVDAMYAWKVDDELHLIFRGTNHTLYRRKVQEGATLTRAGSTVTVTLTAHGFSVGNRVTVVSSSNGTLFPPATFTIATVPTANSFTFTSAGTAGSATSGVIATPVAYSGTYQPPTGHPMRFWEAGGSLFFTTSEGPFRLDTPTSTPVLAGAPPGIEGKVELSNTSGGWLNYGETVGYRYTWAKRTATTPERLLEGAPSGRILLTNLVQDATPTAFTWTRSGDTVTITDNSHGLSNGDPVVVTESSDTSALPLGVYTVANAAMNTFDVEGVDAGLTSGSGEYVGDDDGVRNVLCTAYVPDGVVLGEDFCKVHRTVNTTTDGTDPGEDYSLVAERYPSADEITARETEIEDFAPFASGADAYFSALSGGVANAAEQPPLIVDAIAFKDYVLGVAPLQRRAIPLSLLAVGGDAALAAGDGLKLVLPSVNSENYTATPVAGLEDTGGGIDWLFYVETTKGVSANIEQTAKSLVRVINHRSTYWYATYVSGDADPPGQIILTERALYQAAASYVQAIGNHKAWSPGPRNMARGDFARVGATVQVDVAAYANAHHFVAGDRINVLVGTVDFPAGLKTVTNVVTSTVFEYAEAGAATSATNVRFDNNTNELEFESVLFDNSWVYSAPQQWESFPPLGQVTLGGPTSELFRFEQFGTVGLFYNNEGLWRLTGQEPTDFNVDFVPGGGESVRLFAPNTVAKNSTGVYALAEDGVIRATDSAFNPRVSDGIKAVLEKFTSGSEALKEATKQYAWALGNDAEREYWLFLPNENAATPSTTTQAYVYSARAAAKGGTGWTRYTSGARTGVYSRADQRMYLAPNSAGPILRERRDLAATDFRNETYTGGVSFVAEPVPFRGKAADLDKQWVKAVVSATNTTAHPMPAYLGMDFSTSNNGHSTWYPDGPHQHEAFNGTYQTYIPEETCRGKELGMRLSHSTASEWLRITGLTVWFNQAAR
jgi:hypothetical protein